MSGQVSAAGDIKYHEVLIDGQNITQFVAVTQIFQDIFTPFWSAQIMFADTQNMVMNLPIKPGAKVDITVESDFPKSQAGRKKFTFFLYKISDREAQKQDTQMYVLHCVSEQFWNNQKTRVSKAFSNQKPDAIVNELVGNMGGSIEEADKDPTQYDVLIPNWSPVNAIEWVTKFAKSPTGGADFLFYQSDTGKFKFRSLEKMMKDRSGVEFLQTNPNTRENSNKEDEETYFNIERYEFIHQHDAVRNFQTGYYGNRLITHDIISKSITQTDFTYGDDIPDDAEKKPFDSPLFEGAHDTSITYYPVHPTIRDGLTPEETSSNWVGSRKTNVMKLEENRLIAQVNGFGKMWELLGKSVNIKLPSHQDLDEGQLDDKYFKGDYVVTAIKHAISHGKYRVVLELAKKRLDKPYE